MKQLPETAATFTLCCARCPARRIIDEAARAFLDQNNLPAKCHDCGTVMLPEAMQKRTFWNYQPTPARKVRVIVGPCERETYWHNGLEGSERHAVEINYGGHVFYLDNETGEGWLKVTAGRGGPEYGHAELPVAKVVTEAGGDQ